jgi:predicted RNase H-like HicB family nuclease
MQIHYPAVLVRVKRGYGLCFPDVPGCVAFGRTQGEAAEKGAGALLARLELLAARGDEPPEPSRLEELEPEPGEVGRLLVAAGPFALQRVNVSLEGPLLARIDAAARRAGLNRSQFLAEAARRLCDAGDAGEAVGVEPAEVRSARLYLARVARERGLSVEALMAEGRAFGAAWGEGG